MTTFDDDARTAASELAREDRAAGQAGEHLDPARVAAYRQGTLPAAEEDAVRAHLALCSDCAEQVLTAPGAQLAPPAAAVSTAARTAFGLAAVLLAAVLGLGLWNLSLRTRSADLETRVAEQARELAQLRRRAAAGSPSDSVYLASLRPAGSLRDAAAPPQVVAPPPGTGFVAFVLAAGEEMEGPTFQVEIRRADGEVAWSADALPRGDTGTVSWLLRPQALPPGDYVVHLALPGGGEVARYPVRYEPAS